MRKKKVLVRPTCAGIYYFNCNVCCAKFTKQNAHEKCYKKYCPICMTAFISEEYLKEHANEYHEDNFCELCHCIIENMKFHYSNYH